MEKKQVLVDYWIKSSEYDYEAAADLMKSGKYAHALFFGHLSVEKMLKAHFINIREEYPPKTHNLLMLIKSLNIDFPGSMSDDLIVINTFNIEARYPDEKFEFYQRCTSDFANKYIKAIEEILEWLKKKL